MIAVFVGITQLTLLSKNTKIRKVGETVKSKMVYNGMIRLVLVSIVYFMLGVMLNLRFGIKTSAISFINTGLSLFVALAMI